MSARTRFLRLLDEAPGDAEAIEHDGAWTTWGTLRHLGERLESELRERGLAAGTRVGVVLENRPEHVGVLLAVIATERCVVTLSGMQPPQRLSADIGASDVPVLVASSEMLARPGIREAAGDAIVLCLSATGLELVADGRPAGREASPGVVVEMLTSGTTGPPKRVRISDRQFDAALATSVPEPPAGDLFRSGVTLLTAPLVHIGGFWGALGPIYAGRRIVMLGKFSLEPWLAAVRAHRPRAVSLVPAALRTVLSAGVPAEDLASVEVVTTGTAPCPPELIDDFLDTYGIRVLPTYGATEFAGAVALWSHPMHQQWWERKKGSAGRALPGTRLRVVDADGTELAADTVGHLEIRTRQSPVGADTWLRTSDLAAIDADGFLWIHGRADDAIVRGGFKVHPEQVRKVLETHPAVREAAVAPLPDKRLGQVPVAAVELEPGAVVPAPGELVAHCREALLPYEVPTYVAVLDALPRTPSEKVSRVDLLELVTAELARVAEPSSA
jgi:acyl-coenzyme A synthetase/AMP-(fatty) acid ligase